LYFITVYCKQYVYARQNTPNHYTTDALYKKAPTSNTGTPRIPFDSIAHCMRLCMALSALARPPSAQPRAYLSNFPMLLGACVRARPSGERRESSTVAVPRGATLRGFQVALLEGTPRSSLPVAATPFLRTLRPACWPIACSSSSPSALGARLEPWWQHSLPPSSLSLSSLS